MTEELTNPYDELGVPPDADEAAVKAAYRRVAKKCHPDVAVDKEAHAKFERAGRAVAILKDPARRRRFDETGKIDDEPVDNARATALTIVESFIEQRVAAFINSDFKPENDPRNFDLVAIFREQMNQELGSIEVAGMQCAKAKRFLADMAKRWRTTDPSDPVTRAFELRVRRMEEKAADLKRAAEDRILAMKIMGAYQFKWDEPAAAHRFDHGRRHFVLENRMIEV